MNILYICHRFPFPPKRGGKIRPFNMIKHLSRSHRVTVCSLIRSSAEAHEGAGLVEHCARYEAIRVYDGVQMARMVARLPTTVPSSFGYFYSSGLAKRVKALVKEASVDLAFVHCSSVARYVENLNVPKILDFGDMDSQKWRDYAQHKPLPLCWGYRLEATKLEREEARLARKFDLCTATTRAEWQTLEAYGTASATDWFPNGVDAEYFTPSAARYDENTIIFVGRMDYFPNQECMTWFCDKILPELRQRRPGTQLVIVGADPTPAMRKLGERAGVVVTGSVPDVRPYLAKAALMVAPLNIARGTQNKILEGMASGVPVVASRVAAGGVDALTPEHMLVASTPEEFVTAIVSVMEDRSQRARLARAGRERMLSHHSWPQSMRRLDGIIERCAASVEHRSNHTGASAAQSS